MTTLLVVVLLGLAPLVIGIIEIYAQDHIQNGDKKDDTK